MFLSTAMASTLELSSPTIKPNAKLNIEQVFNGFGCTGKNISPELNWTAGPKGTKSYALTMYDPDAPTGSGWWHWVVYNLPSDTTHLAQGAGEATGRQLPSGTAQGKTDFGSAGFGGACPPQGDEEHRYIFTIYALKTDKIELPADASAAMIAYMIKSNSLAQASITAKYGRKK